MRVLATLLDNSVAWVVADLAAARAVIVHVPLPAFFSPEQIGHALRAAGVDAMLAGAAVAGHWQQRPAPAIEVAGAALVLIRMPASAPQLPDGTSKITVTSGTTGHPKGVCLRTSAMDAVAQGLVQAMAPLRIGRHLCVLPLAPDSLILLPQMLRLWTAYLAGRGLRAPAGLKFVAVGGASVGTGLVAAARAR